MEQTNEGNQNMLTDKQMDACIILEGELNPCEPDSPDHAEWRRAFIHGVCAGEEVLTHNGDSKVA